MAKTSTKTAKTPAETITGPTTVYIVPRVKNRNGDPEVSGEAWAPPPEVKAAEEAKDAASRSRKSKAKAGTGSAVATLDPPTTTEIEKPLTPDEKRDARRLDQVIQKGIRAYDEAGAALIEMYERGLWRAFAPTWGDYTEAHVGLGERRARQIVQASRVAAALPERFSRRVREDHARTLAALPNPADRVRVLEALDAQHPGEPFKSREIRDTIETMGLLAPAKAERTPKPKAEATPDIPVSFEVLAGSTEAEVTDAEPADTDDPTATLTALLGGAATLREFSLWYVSEAYRRDPSEVEAAVRKFKAE